MMIFMNYLKIHSVPKCNNYDTYRLHRRLYMYIDPTTILLHFFNMYIGLYICMRVPVPVYVIERGRGWQGEREREYVSRYVRACEVITPKVKIFMIITGK